MRVYLQDDNIDYKGSGREQKYLEDVEIDQVVKVKFLATGKNKEYISKSKIQKGTTAAGKKYLNLTIKK
ncbi:hypothetical protein [Photorhabdus temperata]|uniref:Uncharacterized protein n=1 Tax=Photorhabdus temperata J3 TaxID=1389415 RepID=U7QUN5_PHOTE|nr:hypothetical protein [Photorhabdus temperata]EQB98041.1 hypothetical protein B738_27332 [Photorhabdus temperata subsp. temperata M1021]ERT10967.1 hypothetical protein O185_21960 [Photorhabdus temperata J3]